MDFYKLNEVQFILFALVLIRMTALMVSWPVFGENNVPVMLKILTALGITFLVFPILKVPQETIDALGRDLVFIALREVVIGLLIGYIARFFFFAFSMAGEIISVTMGLASAQIFNPSLGSQSASTSQFYLTLASLFFLAVNGHHILLSGLVESFQFLPVSAHWFKTQEFFTFAESTQTILLIGVKLSAPVLISILVVNLILGVAGKTVPQMNVLVTSFAVNIFVGLAILIVSLPLFMDQMGSLLQITSETLFKFMRAI
jgi:flagellar biosynthetic protein FliR